MLFFLLNSFPGEDAELKEIGNVLGLLGSDLGRKATLDIPKPNDSNDRSVERALHRLVVLGVLEDYTIDWGSKKYSPLLANCSPAQVTASLISYVRRSQPAQAEVLAARLEREGVDVRTLDEAILKCASELIRFVYDTVERSRRRSLREMWLAAKDGVADPNGKFRERILDYLSQGSVAPTLEKLVDEATVDFRLWVELLDEVWASHHAGDPEAGLELRGGTARLLASYPEHPGLLVARGVSELYVEDGDLEELAANLKAARHSGGDRYGITSDDYRLLANWLYDRAAAVGRSGAATSVAIGLGDVAQTPAYREGEKRDLGLDVLRIAQVLDMTRDQLELVATGLPHDDQHGGNE